MAPRPLRILQYLCRFRTQDGGVPRAVIDLSEALAARGHDVTVLSRQGDSLPPEWFRDVPGLPKVIDYGRGDSRRDRVGLSGSLNDHLKSADVVHLHGVWDQFEVSMAKECRRIGKPYIVTPHGMLDQWTIRHRGFKKRVFLALVGRRMLEGAAGVHCTSQEEARQSERWYPAGKSVVLPLLVNLSAFQTLPGPESAEQTIAMPAGPTIVFLGRVHPIKRIEHLIDAAGQLARSLPSLRLVIAGSGDQSYTAKLSSRAERSGLTGRVRWLGHVDGTLKVSLLQAADVFVLPSSHENWGIALFEAMAAGAPVITTRGVNVWQEVEGSGGARIVNARCDGLAAAVEELIRAPDLSQGMGAKGRAWVMRNLRAEQVVREYEKAYMSALEG